MSQAKLISPRATMYLNVVRFQLAFMTQTQTAQLHRGVTHYPIKALQGDFTFQVQYRSDAEFIKMQNFLKDSMDESLGTLLNANALRFLWPEMHFDYSGFVKQSKMGAQKFDFAPKVTYQMTLTRDSIYTPTANYSEVPEWTQLYDKNNPNGTVDVGAAVHSSDPVLPDNPPANPNPSPTNPAPAPAPAPSNPVTAPPTGDAGQMLTNWIASLFS